MNLDHDMYEDTALNLEKYHFKRVRIIVINHLKQSTYDIDSIVLI
jgi:hypothetical protein